MPSTRRKRTRTLKSLHLWEKAFLTNDDSAIVPGSRDAARLKVLRSDPDGFLLYGDRTARQLLEEFPEHRRS